MVTVDVMFLHADTPSNPISGVTPGHGAFLQFSIHIYGTKKKQRSLLPRMEKRAAI